MINFSTAPIRNGLRISTRADSFKILQITDLHLAERYFLKISQLRRLRRLIDRVRPDLIVNTGDFFCRRRLFPPRLIVKLFTALIGKDYPWTFAWGNHDCEAFRWGRWYSIEDWEREFKLFETVLGRTKNCLYVPSSDFIEGWVNLSPGETERESEALLLPRGNGKSKEYFDGFYGGNFKLEIADARHNAKAWDLFIFNSRQNYHIPPQALHWMEGETASDPRPVPAVCFYHVPSRAFYQLWESGLAQGVKGEGIHYLKDDGRVHEAFKRTGTVRACFAGHDHKNDFMGTYEGITYVSGRKTLRFSKGAVDAGQVIVPRLGEPEPLEWGAKLITLGLREDDPLNNPMSVSTIFEFGSRESVSIPLTVPEPLFC